MAVEDSMLNSLKILVRVQNKILNDEVRDHVLYEKVQLLTGLGLAALGFLINEYLVSISPLGWLLVLVGLLRAISSVYDLMREESLKRKMRLVKQQFGDILAMSI